MCTGHLTRLDELTELIAYKIKENLTKYIDVQRVIERLEKEQKTEHIEKRYNEELKRIEREISDKEHIIKSLYVDKAKGIIDENQFIELNKEFMEDKRRLLERQKIIQKEMELNSSNKINYREMLNNLLNFTELTHNMVNSMIYCIEIGEKTPEGKKIIIHWLF